MWEKCWFLREGKTGELGEKALRTRKRTNKLNPHERLDWRIEPVPQWWEVSAPTTTMEIARIKYKSVEFMFLLICCFQLKQRLSVWKSKTYWSKLVSTYPKRVESLESFVSVGFTIATNTVAFVTEFLLFATKTSGGVTNLRLIFSFTITK